MKRITARQPLAPWALLASATLLASPQPSTAADPIPQHPTEPGTVLVLGDSLAAGYGVDPSESFPALLQAGADRISDFYEVRLQGTERMAGREAEVMLLPGAKMSTQVP